MIRTLVIAGMMLAAGPALAEMAAPAPKPAKQITVRGCTSSGYAGCHLLQAGTRKVMLTAKADVVLPPAKTYVIATGTMVAAPANVCGVTQQLIASKIIATRRRCP